MALSWQILVAIMVIFENLSETKVDGSVMVNLLSSPLSVATTV